MKKSYSLLSANHLNLNKDIHEKKDNFENIHFDLTDGIFCPTLGLSIITLEQLSEENEFKIDVHLLVQNPLNVVKRIENLNIECMIFHQETISEEEFKNLSFDNIKKGVAVLPDTSISKLSGYLNYADCVLLLCISPSLFPEKEKVVIIADRVKEFYKIFPNFNGNLIVDGGINKENLADLKKLKVSNVVVGSKFFT